MTTGNCVPRQERDLRPETATELTPAGAAVVAIFDHDGQQVHSALALPPASRRCA
jgi:hypothetical protein